ncbi:Inner centromere protein [Frankliniella fusca]|uniref:Inner centromere protein n=1 Tax=Frankliniella fusca TaxID=407009 RepID=A0AAE1GVB3_9NEOP|nr:Inner centromere protein [Frankliniella fusca]
MFKKIMLQKQIELPFPAGSLFNSQSSQSQPARTHIVKIVPSGNSLVPNSLPISPKLLVPSKIQGDSQELNQEAETEPTGQASEKIPTFRWSNNQILMLLASYELHKEAPNDFSKEDKKMWASIANDLNTKTPPLFLRDVTAEQVKDKINNMKGRLNAKKDHNKQSGNDLKELTHLEERLNDILDASKQGGPAKECTLSSPLFPSAEEGQQAAASSHHTQQPVSGNMRFKRKRQHGTGSKVAAAKLTLETQWSGFLDHQAKMAAEQAAIAKATLSLREREVAARERRNKLMENYMLMKEKQAYKKEERWRKLLDLEERKLQFKRDCHMAMKRSILDD